jgi:hypothetical protein
VTPLPHVWLPILAAAVLVFVATAVIHMVLPIHKGDYRKLPDEDGVLDALRRHGVGAGQYMFPCPSSMADMATPAMLAKYQRGPVGTLTVRPAGPMRMGPALLQWFTFCLVASACTAYLTGLARAPGAADVFRVAAAAATPAYAFASVSDSIWRGVSWTTTAKFVFDGLVCAVVTGAAFAWLWPAA